MTRAEKVRSMTDMEMARELYPLVAGTEVIPFCPGSERCGELLCQLAEEASELAQAALKLRRCYNRTNPARVSKEDAMKALHEEIADVLLSLHVLGLDTDQHCEIYDTISAEKTKRWAKSLEQET